MTRRLILDLSRTLSRAAHAVPTGIDRVELAYAEGLLAREADRLDFAAMHPLGHIVPLPHGRTQRFLHMTAQRWRGGAWTGDAIRRAAQALQGIMLLRGRRAITPHARRRRSVYLLMSHHHLDRPAAIREVLHRENAAFVCMVHDLIPIEYPEYARPNEPARHQRRIETVAQLADAIVVNSADTARSLSPWLARAGRAPPVLVAPLGIDVPQPRPEPRSVPPSEAGPATFLYIGTIEPRKNHLMLLQAWRRLVELDGDAAPRLVLAGRRGWENEQILDMLERCTTLRHHVEERSSLSDAEAHALLGQASALLLPSFAEGYGLPLAEALAQGVPALCSDLPALREVGREVPDYLDPLDGLGWLQAVRDYAAPGSERRAAQLARLRGWQAPSWDTHLSDVLALLDSLD